jgi:dolichol-phosphate mannosyltransferase
VTEPRAKTLAVVVAAYDERPNIEPLIERLDRSLAPWIGRRDLLFVVDGDDGTAEAIEALRSRVDGLRLIRGDEPKGLADAFRRGFAALPESVDYVVTLDADLNHQPEEIPRLLAAARDSAVSIVVGSRDVAGAEVVGIPFWKRSLSLGVNAALSRLGRCRVRDKTSGFRVYRADALSRLAIRQGGFTFLADFLVQAADLGLTIREEPIRFTYRVAGRSKLPFARTSLEYLRLLSRIAGAACRQTFVHSMTQFSVQLLPPSREAAWSQRWDLPVIRSQVPRTSNGVAPSISSDSKIPTPFSK